MNYSEHLVQLHRGVPPESLSAPCALTIGNFDGVHVGHQAMLTRLCSAAKQRGLIPTVMTFEPHPREFFARVYNKPELAPPRISGLRDKILNLADAGVQQIVVQRFTAKFAAIPAEVFIQDLLIDRLNVRWLLVGDDFRFGAGRKGDLDMLVRSGAFEVQSMDSITDREGRRVSSTDVRLALADGDLERVADLLGRNYHMSGHVMHGLKLGRKLGFPTLNVRVPPQCTALTGIFTVLVHGLGDNAIPGVASLGLRPTVSDSDRMLLEVHLLDYNQDAYGKLVKVEFLKKLRDEEKYDDLDALTRAITRDVEHARAYFAATYPAIAVQATAATDRI